MAPAASPIGSNTANSSTIAGSRYITDSKPPSPIQIALPVTGFAVFFLLILVAWFHHYRQMKHDELGLKTQQDPSKRRSRYEKLVPAEKFSLWRQRQCKKLKDPVVFPSDYLCAICISEIVEEDMIRSLPCNHCFHQQCLDPWFRRHHYDCPLCKRRFYSLYT